MCDNKEASFIIKLPKTISGEWSTGYLPDNLEVGVDGGERGNIYVGGVDIYS